MTPDGLLAGDDVRRLLGEVVDAFSAAFPDEPEDTYLADFLVDELAKGGIDLPLA